MKQELVWVAFKTIVIRESKRTFRVWRQSFLPAMVTSILYFVIFGKIIGHRVGIMNGFNYIQYITPGLIMMQLVTGAYTSGVSAFFIAKFQRQIQELQVSSMPTAVMVLGFTVSAIVRGVIVGIIVGAVALLFTHLHIHSLVIVISVSFCSACLFSLAGLINAVYAKTFDDITIVPTFIIAPLTYLGGVFYSIQLLPPFWQTISLLNPIVYIINAFRFGILGIADTSMILAFTVMGFLIIALYIFAYYLIKTGKGMRD